MVKRTRLSRNGSKPRSSRMTAVKMTPIQSKISAMLKENTGVHFMDSGGAYGRIWERNQGLNFMKEPPVKVEVDKDSVAITQNVFHFLTNQLDVSPESEKLNRQFKSFADKPENSDEADLTIMEKWMDEKFPNETTIVDEYSEKDGVLGKVDNTYNYDNTLSQVLQYQMFRQDGKNFILLQVHGGCDVRGGYTTPQVFELTADELVSTWLSGLSDIDASDGVNSWYSDDSGYHWYSGDGKAKDMDDSITGQWRLDPKKNKVFSKLNGKEVKFQARGSLPW